MWSKLLTVLALTMSSLFGGKEAIARPKVKVKIKGSWDSENFLYDSGAQVSLLSTRAFRKIEIGQRPEKIKVIYSAVVYHVQNFH